MKDILTLSILLMMLFASSVHAEMSKTVEVRYIMGDGDTRVTARRVVLEQIRQKACDEAGTFVQSTTSLLENGELQESVRTVSAAMVKINVLEEGLSVDPSGQAVLRISAATSIDDQELLNRVRLLYQDEAKARNIRRLHAENERLRRQLSEIRTSLGAKAAASNHANLLAQQAMMLDQIDENGRTVMQVFERGTLIQMAEQSSDAFAAVIMELDEFLYRPLLRSPVIAQIESIEKLEYPNSGYAAYVRIGWDADLLLMQKTLGKYLDTRQLADHSGIMALRAGNTAGRGPSPFSERVYEYLATHGVDLQLTLAGKDFAFPVLYFDDGFLEACAVNHEARRGAALFLCITSQGKDARTVRGIYPGTNPVRLILTKDEAESATDIKAALIRCAVRPRCSGGKG